ncbi:MAG: phage/plasmid primase, P4 family [Rhodobacteraceae bacterium]|jgi:putative DNA primase/helicase|nr:phage/plasmid primase, P4 family [Paracoccaceae bacterium]
MTAPGIAAVRRIAHEVEDVDLPDGLLPPPDAPPVELTEDGIARAFAERFRDRFAFDHGRRAWFVWDGSRWAQDVTERYVEALRRIAVEASATSPEGARRTARRAGTIGGAERLARADRAFARDGEGWDADPLALGCPGCVVDLATGLVRPPAPGDAITKLAAVAPSDGLCPRWVSFLMDAVGGDEDVVRFLQVWCGYLLTGFTREHCLVFIYGPGGNGKSVFANTFARIMGDYAVASSMDTFTESRGERHPTDLAMLRGARLVTAAETEAGRSWAEARIKAMTGGDPITARFMRGDFFTYQPAFKLQIVGNHQPVLRNVDAAIRRRLLVLPFTWTPERPDPELEARLWEEAPAILGWAIRGAQEWLSEGLPRPSALTAATAEYFAEQDTFGAWFAQSCAPAEFGDVEPAADLFASWRSFAEAAGERPGTAKGLGARMRREGLVSRVQRVGGKPVKVWAGGRLTERAP